MKIEHNRWLDEVGIMNVIGVEEYYRLERPMRAALVVERIITNAIANMRAFDDKPKAKK